MKFTFEHDKIKFVIEVDRNDRVVEAVKPMPSRPQRVPISDVYRRQLKKAMRFSGATVDDLSEAADVPNYIIRDVLNGKVKTMRDDYFNQIKEVMG